MLPFDYPIKDATATLRQATRDDIPRLVELDRLCFPTMVEEDVVWTPEHLLSHQKRFPDGQIVAEVDNVVVGAVATLIVDLGADPLRPHTYWGITDDGYFYNHTPSGDTLYGADIYVHPDFRSRGVGAALYAARRDLCKRLNLRRILAGARIHGFTDYADKMTAEEYARKVEAGELRDLVLSFQLKHGFQLRGILDNYIHDPNSRNHAALIEWLNPDYTPRSERGRRVRLACVQYQVRKVESWEDFEAQVEYFVETAADYRADFVLLPELFSVQLLSCYQTLSSTEGISQLADQTPRFIEMLSDMARRYGFYIIGGSHPVRRRDVIFNECLIFAPDGSYIAQPKIHITPDERKYWGITGGDALYLIDTPKVRFGVLICYDVEFPETARYLADMGAEVIFVPYCTDNRHGHLRVNCCAQARAIENQIYVATAGIIGNLPSVPAMDIHYGQAHVYTPSDFEFARDGIQAMAEPNVETMVITDLDLDALYTSRAGGSVTQQQDRRPDLFQFMTSLKNADNPVRKMDDSSFLATS